MNGRSKCLALGTSETGCPESIEIKRLYNEH